MTVAAPHDLPEFLKPLWAWIEATPVYILIVLFLGLISLAVFEVHSLVKPAHRITLTSLALCHSPSRRPKTSSRSPRRETVHHKPSYRTNTASTSAMLVRPLAC